MFLEGLQIPSARVILLLMSNFSTRLDVPDGIEGAKLWVRGIRLGVVIVLVVVMVVGLSASRCRVVCCALSGLASSLVHDTWF